MVKLLLEKGAKVEAKSDDGTTALQVARRAGKAEVVKLLRGKGAQWDEYPVIGFRLSGDGGERRRETLEPPSNCEDGHTQAPSRFSFGPRG